MMKQSLLARCAYSLLPFILFVSFVRGSTAGQKTTAGAASPPATSVTFADISPWIWVVSGIVLLFVIMAFVKGSGPQIDPSPSQDILTRRQKETEE